MEIIKKCYIYFFNSSLHIFAIFLTICMLSGGAQSDSFSGLPFLLFLILKNAPFSTYFFIIIFCYAHLIWLKIMYWSQMCLEADMVRFELLSFCIAAVPLEPTSQSLDFFFRVGNIVYILG